MKVSLTTPWICSFSSLFSLYLIDISMYHTWFYVTLSTKLLALHEHSPNLTPDLTVCLTVPGAVPGLKVLLIADLLNSVKLGHFFS